MIESSLFRKYGLFQSCIPGAILVYAVAETIRQFDSDEFLEAFSLLGVCLVFCIQAFFRAAKAGGRTRATEFLAWGILAAAFPLIFIPTGVSVEFTGRIILLSAVCAVWLRFCGALSPELFLAGASSFLLVPFREQISLFAAIPIRVMTSDSAVCLIRLFGIDAASNGTTIVFPDGNAIAITSGCSGIGELWGLFLILTVFACVIRLQSRLIFLYILMLPPMIFLANVLRIVVLAFFTKSFGPKVFVGLWHTGFGYFQLILALLLIFTAGWVLSACGRVLFEKGSRTKC